MSLSEKTVSVVLWPVTATLKKISLGLVNYADRKVERMAAKQGIQFTPEMDDYRQNMDKLRDAIENPQTECEHRHPASE
jgi:hypothetical protein